MKFNKNCNPFTNFGRKKKDSELIPSSDNSGIQMRHEGVDAIEDFYWKNRLDSVDASDQYRGYPAN